MLPLSEARYAAITTPLMVTHYAKASNWVDGAIVFTKKSGEEFTIPPQDLVSMFKDHAGITVTLLDRSHHCAPFPLDEIPKLDKTTSIVRLVRKPDRRVFFVPKAGVVLFKRLPTKDPHE